MQTNINVRRLAATAAVISAAAGGIGLVASPANAATATGSKATLRRGTVTVTGTAVRDLFSITIDTDQVTVDFGFDGTVDAQFPMSRVQRLVVNAGAGDDGVSIVGSGVGDVPITISGGGGNDGGGVVSFADPILAGNAPVTIFGNDGNDNLLSFVPGPVTIDAGAGDDQIESQLSGEATISLGDGNDTFLSGLSAPIGFRRSDVVDGGTGQDTMEMGGNFASESVNLSANAGHLNVAHDFGDRIDADNIEDVTWVGFGGLDEGGGGDAVAVNDLSGTDVVRFTPGFTDPLDNTGPNNSSDTLTVRGTAGADRITVAGSGTNITVAGLTPTVTPVNLDSNDVLRIETLDGDDAVDSRGLQRGLVQLQVL